MPMAVNSCASGDAILKISIAGASNRASAMNATTANATMQIGQDEIRHSPPLLFSSQPLGPVAALLDGSRLRYMFRFEYLLAGNCISLQLRFFLIELGINFVETRFGGCIRGRHRKNHHSLRRRSSFKREIRVGIAIVSFVLSPLVVVHLYN